MPVGMQANNQRKHAGRKFANGRTRVPEAMVATYFFLMTYGSSLTGENYYALSISPTKRVKGGAAEFPHWNAFRSNPARVSSQLSLSVFCVYFRPSDEDRGTSRVVMGCNWVVRSQPYSLQFNCLQYAC